MTDKDKNNVSKPDSVQIIIRAARITVYDIVFAVVLAGAAGLLGYFLGARWGW